MKDKRIQVLMSEAELAAIDKWRFANHMSSRGEAIRRLCECALEAFAPPLDNGAPISADQAT